jgi:hypothetical protein
MGFSEDCEFGWYDRALPWGEGGDPAKRESWVRGSAEAIMQDITREAPR